MPDGTEAFSRVKIDAQLRDVGWAVEDGVSVRFEYTLSDGTRADYVLCNRHGHAVAVLEAKRTSRSARDGERQGRSYAELLGVPFVYLSNGEELWAWEPAAEAHPRPIKTLPSQLDLERLLALREQRRDPLTVPIDTRIAGRDYQQACIDTLCQEIKLGRRKMLVEMATGTGKTRTAAALIKRLFEAGQVSRVLFLVDRITLAKQAEDAFAEYLPEFPAYVLRAGRRFQDEKRITVSTLQTFIGEYHKLPSSYFQLVIVDECHRSIYGKWSGTLRHFDALMVGLTATPCVAAPGELRDLEDGAFVRDTLRFFEVDQPTFRYGIKQAIQEGHLLPYKIYKAKTVKTAAEDGFEVRRDELDWSAMDPDTKAELEWLFGADDKIVVDPNALERKFTIPERNRAIVREYRNVVENGFVGSDGQLRKPMLGKAIAFAVTKRHAETLASMFDQAFADKKPSPEVRFADYVVSGVGADDTVDAFAKIDRFKKEPYPKVLVSVNMLDTGFDAPEVVHLVMARFTRSSILYQQMRGRGTRRADHIKKSSFTIFDFVGVTDYHHDDESSPEGGLVVTSSSGKVGEPSPRKLLVLDVHDHIDPSTREWVTLDEDGNPIQSDARTARAAELLLRYEGWLAEQDFNSDQLRIIRLIENQIEANPTMAGFDLYRFTQPPFSLNGGVPRARQLFGGLDGLNAMLAGLNSAVFQANDQGSEEPPATSAAPN